jgi:hypothetical protein
MVIMLSKNKEAFFEIYSLILLDVLLVVMTGVIAVSLIYSTLKLGISPMPSSSKAYKVMMKLIEETGTGAIIDLGSGWGSFVIRVAKKNPQRKVVGYELSILPWLMSILLKKVLGLNNLTLYRQNFYRAILPEKSVLVCYLYPGAMHKIKNELLVEQSNLGFLISNNFALPSSQPYKIIPLDDFYKSPIYFYKINPKGF